MKYSPPHPVVIAAVEASAKAAQPKLFVKFGPANLRQFRLALLLLLTSHLACSALAQVLFYENFDSATPGQTLAEAPLNWTLFAGSPSLRVAANVHPGWVGNAIVMQSPPIEAYYRHPIGIATGGTVVLSFRCWAYLGNGNGQVHLDNMDNGANRIIIATDTNHPNQFYLYSNGRESYFGSGLFDKTTFVNLYIDLDEREVWSVVSDGLGRIGRSQVLTVTSSFMGTHINLGEFRGGFDIDELKVRVKPVPQLKTISGTINLSDYSADVFGQEVEVRIDDFASQSPELQTVTLGPGGTYSLITMREGDANVSFKAGHWLRRTLGTVEIPAAGLSGLDASLVNGDCDGDNEVTIGDYALLSAAFGSVPGDPNWEPMADLDGDEEVSIGDYAVLSFNFGLAGDD